MGEDIKKQVVSRMVKDSIQMITACFDEYYFIIPEVAIKPVPKNAKQYLIGDKLPVKGETYHFPDDFNIIDLHFGMVAKVRDKRLSDVMPLKEYIYDNVPSLNMMGFYIKLSSEEEFQKFKNHFASFKLIEREKLAEFANRWFDITKYRVIKYQ